MKTNYYQLTESNKCGANMGVVRATNNGELILKIKTLAEEHFDCDIDVDMGDVTVEAIKWGRSFTLKGITEDGNNVEFCIEETWVY